MVGGPIVMPKGVGWIVLEKVYLKGLWRSNTAMHENQNMRIDLA